MSWKWIISIWYSQTSLPVKPHPLGFQFVRSSQSEEGEELKQFASVWCWRQGSRSCNKNMKLEIHRIFALSCESQIIFSYSVSFSILFWRVSFNIYILHAKFIVFCFFSVSRRWSSCTQTRSSIETSRATTSCWAWTAPSSSVSPQKLTVNS